MKERLQKYMASCGIASRRKCEEIILDGRVRVNGNIVTELGFKVEPGEDKVCVDSKLISLEEKKVYIALNKPIGYVSTVKDERGRKTILDIVKVNERIFPIGRLDYNTSGLLLLTNDGDIYNKVIHPRKEVNKIYIAIIKGTPTEEEIHSFCNGVDIGGYITSHAEFKVLNSSRSTCEVQITIHEGKNKQIRRMCDKINHPVIRLRRISVGTINLDNIEMGTWRHLTTKEINYLKSL